MTNSPEAMTPDSNRGSTATDAAAAAVPDAGPEFERLVEPRSENRLSLEGGVWHQISPKYVVAEVLLRLILLVIIAVGASAATTLLAQPWPWAWTAAGVIAVAILVELVILPRQARAIGYMLRADDIVFRRGILWQRMIAVPYGRMQLVDITRGPVDRAFGIAKLKLVTAAATTGVEIPGMTEDAAEALRDTLIDVAEMRRTGL